MNSPSLVRPSIDFDSPGKQFGFLGVPKSTNDSAYGTITVPVCVINNGEGPTVTLTGGVHGDEYEGPVTLLNLAREIDPAQVNGRIIMIPCLNLPAVQSGDRCSPIDDLNLNRVFPGNANGTVTEMVAHYISLSLIHI